MLLKNITLLLLHFCLYSICFSQSISLDWVVSSSGVYEGIGEEMAIDNDGNVYLTGGVPQPGNQDPNLAKYDSLGNLIWGVNSGSDGSGAADIAIDCSGHLYVIGRFSGWGDFNPTIGVDSHTSAGFSDIYITKYDTSGTYMWTKTFGGVNTENAYNISVDNQGNILVRGEFTGTADFDPSAGIAEMTSNGNVDIFISKYDSNGNYQWAKQIGGVNTEYGEGLELDYSGNVYLAGRYSGTVDFDPNIGVENLTSTGLGSMFILKLDSNGSYVWAQSIDQSILVNDIVLGHSSESIYITGSIESDIYLSKYSFSGNEVWTNIMEGTINGASGSGYGVTVDGIESVFITGQIRYSFDFDPSASTSTLSSVNGNQDIFLAKYSSDGDYEWGYSFGGANNESGKDIQTDKRGNPHISGRYNSIMDFDPSAGVYQLNGTLGLGYLYCAKYNSNGIPILTIDSCESYTNSQGVILTNPGVYSDTVWEANSCLAKIYNLNLTISTTPILVVSQTDTICGGESITLNASGANQYSWDNGAGNSSTPLVSPVTTTTYTVTGSSGSCSATEQVEIVVKNAPQPIISNNGGILSTGTFVDYQWYLGSNPILGEINQTYTYSQNGDYQVEVTDTNECTNFSPSFIIEDVSIEEYPFNLVSVYPNPFDNEIHIEFQKEIANGEIRIINSLGKVAFYSKVYTSESLTIEFGNMPKGVYYLQIKEEDFISYIKLIRQ